MDLRAIAELVPADPALGSSHSEIQLEGPPFEGSAFAVQTAADLSVGAAVSAAVDLGLTRGLPPTDPPVLNRGQTLGAFSGRITVNGEPPPIWADLSGMYRTADNRFIQLHCNFAHHARGVVDHLGVEPERTAVEAAIGKRAGHELEAELIDRGLIAALCRTLEEWDNHPHAAPTADLPLLSATRLGDAPPRPIPTTGSQLHAGATAAGVRVIDCSRVLAGPVCGQMLAAVGADVLRVGAAHLPSVDVGVISTGFGKRNTFLNLDREADRASLRQLVATGHVFVDAYRPGALARRGFAPEDIAVLAPGAIVVQLCAFDWEGPWAGRRGFDSIVQSTTGIALAGGAASESDAASGPTRPMPLPVQALDYATGYLAAFAALRLLSRQQTEGGSWLVRLSLLRTRNWLLSLGAPRPFQPSPLPDLTPWLHNVDSDFGELVAPAPIIGQWRCPPSKLGSSPASWL
ncbi:MAG: crotonobetainyl-CoA:carnitine CoA-transferase CaiB-like acyl-CoA transferase [Acidimicrobiales bacterium]|jgi:hypothetical protein